MSPTASSTNSLRVEQQGTELNSVTGANANRPLQKDLTAVVRNLYNHVWARSARCFQFGDS
jgi:type VI protein secretion system component VasK